MRTLLVLVALLPLTARAVEVPVLTGGIQVNEPDHAVWAAAVGGAGLDSVQVTVYARQGAWDSADLTFPEDVPSVEAEIRAAKAAGLGVVLVLRVYLEHALPENRHLWHGMVWPADTQVAAWFARYRAFARWGAELAARTGVDLFVVGNELSSLTSTTLGPTLPDLYAYQLDPARMAAVRARRTACARRVRAEALRPDLAWRDGTEYETLDALLRAEEEVLQRWTAVVTGLAPSSAAGPRPLPARLAARRALHERYWRALIAELRGVYGGPITYGANFDQFEEVGFWDALDAIGLTGYFPLSRWGTPDADLDAVLMAHWRDVAARIEHQARLAGGDGRARPALFLELGWTRRAGSTVRPYSYVGVEAIESDEGGVASLTCVHWATQPVDPRERVRALRALLEVVEAGVFPSLRGFSLWKLTTDPGHRAIEPFAVVLARPDRPPVDVDVDLLDAANALARALR